MDVNHISVFFSISIITHFFYMQQSGLTDLNLHLVSIVTAFGLLTLGTTCCSVDKSPNNITNYRGGKRVHTPVFKDHFTNMLFLTDSCALAYT